VVFSFVKRVFDQRNMDFNILSKILLVVRIIQKLIVLVYLLTKEVIVAFKEILFLRRVIIFKLEN